MAILTKAALRTAIDSAFASAQRITAEQARSEFHDWIDSLLDAPSVVAGAGISVSRNAGVVTVATGGAAASAGMPSYLADNAAQASDGVLTAEITGLTDSPPFPSLVYLTTPAVLNRAAVDIELQINGDTSRVRGIRDASGNLIYARDLIPNTLYPLLAGFVSAMQEYIITEHLASRPQDFQIACAVSVDEDLSAVAIADGTVSPVDSGDFLLPVYTDRSYIFIGVPTDAPDINSVLILGGQNIGSFTVDAGVLNYGTVPYKWTRTTNQVPPSLSGLALFVGTEDFY